MGDSSRRKKLDSNYGKYSPAELKLIEYCDTAIQKQVTINISDFFNDKDPGITITHVDNFNFETRRAYEMGLNDSNIKLGLQKKRKHLPGFLHISENYLDRKQPISVNWQYTTMSKSRIAEPHLLSKGKSVIYQIIDYLILNCDKECQFPLLYTGIPFPDSIKSCELIMVCDSRDCQ